MESLFEKLINQLVEYYQDERLSYEEMAFDEGHPLDRDEYESHVACGHIFHDVYKVSESCPVTLKKVMEDCNLLISLKRLLDYGEDGEKKSFEEMVNDRDFEENLPFWHIYQVISFLSHEINRHETPKPVMI